MKKISVFALLILSACSANSAEHDVVAEGSCVREIEASVVRNNVEIDVDKAIGAGFNILRTIVNSGADIMENRERKEYSVDANVRVKSGDEVREYNAPITVSVPKITGEDIDSFVNDITASLPEPSDIVRLSRDAGISDARVREEQKACVREAFGEARGKASAAGKVVRVKDVRENTTLEGNTLKVNVVATFVVE